ncbi:MAG: hypothetical protein VYA34_05965 [Myxococcota bacterium]|nr:hypothetical protein [Myxococcota bacterium]
MSKNLSTLGEKKVSLQDLLRNDPPKDYPDHDEPRLAVVESTERESLHQSSPASSHIDSRSEDPTTKKEAKTYKRSVTMTEFVGTQLEALMDDCVCSLNMNVTASDVVAAAILHLAKTDDEALKEALIEVGVKPRQKTRRRRRLGVG